MASGRPPKRWRVLLTRPDEQSDESAELVRALGGEPLLFPGLHRAPPDDPQPLLRAVGQLSSYSLVAVTSANAVAALAEALAEQGRPPQLGQALFAAVGPHTAAALTSRGFAVGLVAGLAGEESSAAGLSRAIAQQLGDGALRPILFLRAAAARPTLVDSLHRAGLVVDDVVAYQMVEATAASLAPLAELLRQGAVDAAPFGSPRTVAIVCTALRAAGCDPVALLGPLRVGAIGTTTAAALRAVGVRVDVVGQSGSFAELIEKLRRLR